MIANSLSDELDPNAFKIHRVMVRDAIEISYVREGTGGLPIVLVHGWPGSKRLFWRNIRPLAAAGFDVIVPDARGYGDSSVPSERRRYADRAASAMDIKELLESIGVEHCIAAGGDWGSTVVQDLSLRFPGLVLRQIIYNGGAPAIPDLYNSAGVHSDPMAELKERTVHYFEQAERADELSARLDTYEKRLDYVKGFFLGRAYLPGGDTIHQASPGSFDDASATFHSEQLADAPRFRASMGYYEAALDPKLAEAPSLLFQRNETTRTLVLYGMDDQIISPWFARRMEVAMKYIVGPYLIERAGHWLQWERPDLFNRAVTSFCADLLPRQKVDTLLGGGS